MASAEPEWQTPRTRGRELRISDSELETRVHSGDYRFTALQLAKPNLRRSELSDPQSRTGVIAELMFQEFANSSHENCSISRWAFSHKVNICIKKSSTNLLLQKQLCDAPTLALLMGFHACHPISRLELTLSWVTWITGTYERSLTVGSESCPASRAQ